MTSNSNTPVWDIGSNRPILGTLYGNMSTDVCIVGLGGSGLSAAVHAAELGHRVVAIDSKFIAAEAAGRNGGFLLNGFAKFYHETRKQLGVEKNKQFYQGTLDEITWLQERVPSCMKITGVLRGAESDEEIEDCKEHLNALREDGFEAEYYEGDQGAGIIITSDGVFNPVSRAVGLAERCRSLGVRLFHDTPALSFEPHLVKTQYGSIHAELVIVAVDGKLHKIFPQLADKIQPVRLQMTGTKPSKKRFEFPVYSNYGYDYWQQLPDGRVIIGGGRHIDEQNEYTDIMDTTEKVQRYLQNKLHSIGVEDNIERSWSGIVGYTNDGIPIKEEVLEGVWAVGGYNGTGNLMGPLYAKNILDSYYE